MNDQCKFFLFMSFVGLIATLFNPWFVVGTGLFIGLAVGTVKNIDAAAPVE